MRGESATPVELQLTCCVCTGTGTRPEQNLTATLDGQEKGCESVLWAGAPRGAVNGAAKSSRISTRPEEATCEGQK